MANVLTVDATPELDRLHVVHAASNRKLGLGQWDQLCASIVFGERPSLFDLRRSFESLTRLFSAQTCSSTRRLRSKMAANSQNTLELKTEEWVSG
jgi:hypothetical protein